jgi:penicillin-binding protein 2
VENAGFGSTYAAPIATLMMKKYLQGDFEKPYYEEIILEANMIE